MSHRNRWNIFFPLRENLTGHLSQVFSLPLFSNPYGKKGGIGIDASCSLSNTKVSLPFAIEDKVIKEIIQKGATFGVWIHKQLESQLYT